MKIFYKARNKNITHFFSKILKLEVRCYQRFRAFIFSNCQRRIITADCCRCHQKISYQHVNVQISVIRVRYSRPSKPRFFKACPPHTQIFIETAFSWELVSSNGNCLPRLKMPHSHGNCLTRNSHPLSEQSHEPVDDHRVENHAEQEIPRENYLNIVFGTAYSSGNDDPLVIIAACQP